LPGSARAGTLDAVTLGGKVLFVLVMVAVMAVGVATFLVLHDLSSLHFMND
jgi:hypothetical protein